MTFLSTPIIQENQRPAAVSFEANFIRSNVENCQTLFVGNSVFIREMYKQQVRRQFDYLNNTWQAETLFSSSINEIVNNSAYRSIINLGGDVLPLIINDLKTTENHWFYALEAITGHNPIKAENKGIVSFMKNDWIEWAENNII